jgi:hypothetical protein
MVGTAFHLARHQHTEWTAQTNRRFLRSGRNDTIVRSGISPVTVNIEILAPAKP